ncbi:phage fiber-tail adaptor protein [Paraburkholderia sp. RL18-085-BIA-A]|uniref:phage fiber-tail adaptor protein n=1 Tax=Paraburkholderia sp. RL18-085-BIA-A TaxID=3031633 RepID=UPI0038BB3AF6
MVTVQKDPAATLDYGFDLSGPATALAHPWLAPGEAVIDLTVTADTGLTVTGSSINTNASGVPAALLLAWISGGVAGNTYNVSFKFTTNSTPPRTDCRSLQINCAPR